METVSSWRRLLLISVLMVGVSWSLPSLRKVRQALEGFPDGLPEGLPKGVRLSLEQMLNGVAEMGPIPGEAGVDYPVFNSVPDTGFQCGDQASPGIFTDPESECQAFYMCSPGGDSSAFLCPNGTIFNQQYFVCDWWYNIDCADQPSFYNLNELLNEEPKGPTCKTLFCKDD